MNTIDTYRLKIAKANDENDVIDIIADYIIKDSQCFMPIVVGGTKYDYGIRLLKALAEEIRTLKA